MLRTYAVLMCLLIGANAQAGDWTPPLTVSYAFTEATSDLVVFTTAGGGQYASGCAVNAWMFNGTTEARRARGYAALLTAVAGGKRVRLWFDDNCTTWGYHSATAVMVLDQ